MHRLKITSDECKFFITLFRLTQCTSGLKNLERTNLRKKKNFSTGAAE